MAVQVPHGVVQGCGGVEAEVRGTGRWGRGGQEADEGAGVGGGEGGARVEGCAGIWRFVKRLRSWVFRPEDSEGAGRALTFGAVEDVAVYFVARLRVRLRKLKWGGAAGGGVGGGVGGNAAGS